MKLRSARIFEERSGIGIYNYRNIAMKKASGAIVWAYMTSRRNSTHRIFSSSTTPTEGNVGITLPSVFALEDCSSKPKGVTSRGHHCEFKTSNQIEAPQWPFKFQRYEI